MNQYPLWKYLVIAVAVLLGLLYTLPNLYGEDPAVQVGASRGTLDESTPRRVKQILTKAGVDYQSIVTENAEVLVRFNGTEDQLRAVDLIQSELGSGYSVALNLASRTPKWMQAINALPMYLGLDLRGGVHFLLQVDMEAALRQAQERYVSDMRTLLRDERVRYVAINRSGDGMKIQFRDSDDRARGQQKLESEFPDLQLTESEAGGEYYLNVGLSESEQREIRRFAVQQNIITLRNRVNELGVAEPIIQQQGEDRIVVQLPGVQDTARAKKILGATATLEYRLVDSEHSVEEAVAGRTPPASKLYYERNGQPILLDKRIIVTGDQITDASSGIDQSSGQPAVFVNLDAKGARKMGNTTKENVGRPMAVVFIENKTETRLVDGKAVRTSKRVEEVINVATIRDVFSKRFQTTGLDSTQEARDLALLLRAGAMAVPSEIIEERTVGPSLGAENIAQGFNSNIIGFSAIALFMIMYYRLFGVISTLALAVNVLFLVSILSVLQATLTLPGMAGIALTVGMAIDANVLINERVREELRNGTTPQAAIYAGYERAFATILDSNMTTLIAGLALFWLGSGPVRGFAVVLCLGILTSMFSAVMVSRSLVNLIYGRQARLKHVSI